MRDEGLDKVTLEKLKIDESEPNLDKWKNFLHRLKILLIKLILV